jgi:hypothetical protein
MVLLYKESFKVICVQANHREAGHLTVLFCPLVLFFSTWDTIVVYTYRRSTEGLF